MILLGWRTTTTIVNLNVGNLKKIVIFQKKKKLKIAIVSKNLKINHFKKKIIRVRNILT